MTVDAAPPRERGRRRPARRWLPVGVAAAVAAFPVAVWWLTGDRSTVPRSGNPDYAIRPPHLDSGVERGVGVAALAAAIAALLFLGYATAKGTMRAQWWVVIGPLLLAGLIIGSGWRIMTAGVIGANIGAGLVMLLGGPVVAACAVWSAVWAIVLLRRPGPLRRPRGVAGTPGRSGAGTGR